MLPYLSDVYFQLFGQYTGAVWQTGLLVAAVQKAGQQALSAAMFANDASIQSIVDPGSDSRCPTAKWIALDGELNPAWIDGVNALLDGKQGYRTANGEIVTLHGIL